MSLFNDSYKSVLMICEAIDKCCFTQAAVLLRLLLESTSIIHVLAKHPELLSEFRKHYKIRLEINSLTEFADKTELLKKYFPEIDSKEILSYMDYGWIKSVYNPKNNGCKYSEPKEIDLIKLAGFDDIIFIKQNYLDKLSHQSFTSENMLDENGNFPLVVKLLEVTCKLFDYLCCDFHKLTKFEFIIKDEDMFLGNFRELYGKESFDINVE